jgi:hypothetical protein
VALDKTFGHLTYGCLTCSGSTPYLSPDTLGLGVGGNGFIGATGNNNKIDSELPEVDSRVRKSSSRADHS